MAVDRTARQIRRESRERRRSLSGAEQRRASEALARLMTREPLFWRSQRIALYIATDGEIDPFPLLAAAAHLGKACYLPHLKPDLSATSSRELWFLRYAPGDPLAANRYGILEPLPRAAERISPQFLDLVLLPLVAFDSSGNRLGMGLGYYDRTFAFARAANAWRRPRLVGLAHECQRIEALPRNNWDVPLDGVATDRQLYLFDTTESPNGSS